MEPKMLSIACGNLQLWLPKGILCKASIVRAKILTLFVILPFFSQVINISAIENGSFSSRR